MTDQQIIVVGASAGGVEALQQLVGELPRDFTGTMFIVLHIPPHTPSALAEILSRAGPLPVYQPEDGRVFRAGCIHVATSDHHLMVEYGRVLVKRGPKENRARPAVDALFRSAAYAYGPAVTGVVLSGALDDGTPGLWTIKRLGGTTIVQDPDEALVPDMPRNALEQVDIDHVLSVSQIAALLARRGAERVRRKEGPPQDLLERTRLEVEIASQDDAYRRGILEAGELTLFTCPDCHGSLVRIVEGKISRYRCHTGHGFTASALLAGVDESVENVLWEAMRGLEESTMLLNHLSEHLLEAGQADAARLLQEKAQKKSDLARAVHDSLPRHETLSGDVRGAPAGER